MADSLWLFQFKTILKVPVPKSLENEVLINLEDMVSFPTNIIQGEKNENLCLVCKQLDKTAVFILHHRSSKTDIHNCSNPLKLYVLDQEQSDV